MLLKSNELVFRDYQWTTHSDDRVLPNNNVQVVSPFFSLDNSAENEGHDSFRFAIRLVGNSSIFDKFQTVVYFYAHQLENIEVKSVECLVIGKTANQTIRLQTKYQETQVVQVMKSDEFLTYDHLSDKGISLKFRVYVTNANNNIRSHLRFELRDARFGQELWSAALKGQMTDCEFVVVNNQIYLAHRVVVAVRCPALDNIQRINDCNVESFKALLYFLYTGCLLPEMNAVDRQQFNDLVNRFQIKTVVQSNNQTDDGLTRLFLAIQPKLKSRDQLAVEIRENHGKISEAGRGLCLHFDYIRTFRSGETVAPEVFRFDRKGFFGVTLIENQHKNGHNYQLTFSSFHLVGGFNLVNVTYDIVGSSPSCIVNMTKMFEVGGDDETLKVFREGISLPKHSDCNSPYKIHVILTVYLAEMDECWGYRLHDPRLPAQFWSSAQRGDLTDVQLRLGRHLFPVHRAILSARSSVFAAVFKNIECDDSCNNNEEVNADERLSIIDIGEDLDPDVFEDFLVFIYTGRLRTTENMAELWAAANKYDVKTLERIGESVKGRPKMEEMCLTLMSSL